MSQGGGSPPLNLSGAPSHHQRSHSDAPSACGHGPPVRSRGRTFSGRQPSELVLRNTQRTSPTTSSHNRIPFSPDSYSNNVERSTSVSPSLSRSNTYNSRNPYRNTLPPSPIREQPPPDLLAPASSIPPQPLQGGFTPEQWSTITRLVALATESGSDERREELREEITLRKRQQEEQEKARQAAHRERIRRRIESEQFYPGPQSYSPPLDDEQPASRRGGVVPSILEPAYFGSHASAAARRRRDRSITPPKALREAQEDSEPILPVYEDETIGQPNINRNSTRRPRSLSRHLSLGRSRSFRPSRTRSFRDSVRKSIYLPPVDGLFSVADDAVIAREKENLERLIHESWSGPDGFVAVERGSESSLEMTALSTPRKSVHLEEQKAALPPAAQNLPTGGRLFILVTCICMAVFLQALDTTIISTAIPKIVLQFHSLPDVGWYGSAYFLTTCAFQLMWGRIYTFYNLKNGYLISITIFEIGSLICGLATSSIMLIVGRAISGVGSGGIYAGSFIIIAFSTNPASRPKYSALLGSMYGISSVVGPVVGGVFSDKVTWRWCFLINLPLGAVALVGIFFFLRQPAQNAALRNLPNAEKIKRLDWHGALIFIGALTSLFIALQWGGGKYPWTNFRIVTLLFFFGIGVCAWVGIQWWKNESGTVPAHVITQRNIWTAAFSCYCMGGAFFIMLYFISTYFQAIKGSTPLKSGIQSLPTLLGLTIGMTIAGHTHKFVKYHAIYMITSAVLATVGCGLITTWSPVTNSPRWMGYQALFGIGQGLGWQQPLLVAQAFLETKDIPIGTALMSGVKLFGGATFISVGSAVFNNKLQASLRLIPGLNEGAVLSAGASGLREVIHDPAQLDAVKQAYSSALSTTFLISVVLSCLAVFGALGVEWKIPPVRKPPGGAPSGPPTAAPTQGLKPEMGVKTPTSGTDSSGGSSGSLVKIPSRPPAPPFPPVQRQMPQVSSVQGYSISRPVATARPYGN
ncbi:MFS general substrate transporter [Pleomassaria siparia CBS 279.74]|uniref:MFS general substrate transporter n=1 Tax=Pleomassaria siparia CBS 279.74 TaxID=1314801 RepID=A0A6G1K0Y7_9PLEO|nr:MFS general substrate transporter [Pleomassaria siparia CBS 279.74]